MQYAKIATVYFSLLSIEISVETCYNYNKNNSVCIRITSGLVMNV